MKVAEDVTIMVEILAEDSVEEEILKAEKEEVQAVSEVKEAQLLEEKVVLEAKEAQLLEEKAVFLRELQDVLKVSVRLQEKDAQEETNSPLLISR